MSYFMSIVGIIASYFIIRYREVVGDLIGGRYQLAVGIGVFVFFWSVATLTGTDEYLFKPLMYLFGGRNAQTDDF